MWTAIPCLTSDLCNLSACLWHCPAEKAGEECIEQTQYSVSLKQWFRNCIQSTFSNDNTFHYSDSWTLLIYLFSAQFISQWIPHCNDLLSERWFLVFCVKTFCQITHFSSPAWKAMKGSRTGSEGSYPDPISRGTEGQDTKNGHDHQNSCITTSLASVKAPLWYSSGTGFWQRGWIHTLNRRNCQSGIMKKTRILILSVCLEKTRKSQLLLLLPR